MASLGRINPLPALELLTKLTRERVNALQMHHKVSMPWLCVSIGMLSGTRNVEYRALSSLRGSGRKNVTAGVP